MTIFGLNQNEIRNRDDEARGNPENSSLEELASPGFFSGSLPAVKKGVQSGAVNLLASVNKVTGLDYGLDMDSHQVQKAAVEINKGLQPDPVVTGWLGTNIIYPLTKVVTEAAPTIPFKAEEMLAKGVKMLAGAVTVGGTEGSSEYERLKSEGVDENTAIKEGAITGVSQGVGFAAPVAIPGKIATRIGSAIGINEAIGMTQRGAAGKVLRDAGYYDMADQYKVLDRSAMLTDAIFGAAFGALHGIGGKKAPVEIKTETPEFTEKFKDSKVITPEGKPIEVYHGAGAGFEEFSEGGRERWFTSNPQTAEAYSKIKGSEPNIRPAYLDIKNPVPEMEWLAKPDMAFWKEQGHDGVILKNSKGHNNYAVFDNAQIVPKFSEEALEFNRPLPSEVDTALSANNINQYEIDAAPGVPADLQTRNSHIAAMDAATRQLLNNEQVNVTTHFEDPNFIPKEINPEIREGMDVAMKEEGLDKLNLPEGIPTKNTLWQLSSDDIENEILQTKMSDKEKLVKALGVEGAEEFNRLYRKSNSSTDIKGADEAYDKLSEMESNFTPEQNRLVYGIGEHGASVEDLEILKEAHQATMFHPEDTDADIANLVARTMMKIAPDEMAKVASGEGDISQQASFLKLTKGMEELRSRGVDKEQIPKILTKALIDKSGLEPADAADMVGGFIEKTLSMGGRKQPDTIKIPDNIMNQPAVDLMDDSLNFIREGGVTPKFEANKALTSSQYKEYTKIEGQLKTYVEGVVAELNDAQKGERTFMESAEGGSPEVVGMKGTFPEWFKQMNKEGKSLTRDYVNNVAKKMYEGAPLGKKEIEVAENLYAEAQAMREENSRGLKQQVEELGLDVNSMTNEEVRSTIKEVESAAMREDAEEGMEDIRISEQIAKEKPYIQITEEDGTIISAADALAKADQEVALAEHDAGLFDVAINCFIRNGDA